MTKTTRLLVTAAAAAALLGSITVSPASAAPSAGGGVTLIPAKVAQRSAAPASAQADAVLVQSGLSGRCWQADPATITTDGTALRLWDCDTSATNQAFYVTQLADGSFQFQNVQSGRYLDADPGTTNVNGAGVQLRDHVVGQQSQQWTASTAGSGNQRYQNVARHRYLTARGDGSNGTPLQLWQSLTDKSQWWH
jgi:hypothetical protein